VSAVQPLELSSPLKAGAATRKRGYDRAKQALLSLPILGIIGFTLLLGIGAVFGVNAAAHAIGVRTSSTATAFLLGTLITATVLVLIGEVVVFAGGVNWITGGIAEGETGKALARLGPDWKVAHNIAFPMGRPPNTWEVDVDHVAVGPYGVLVVETKYSSAPVSVDRLSKCSRDINQARKNAALIEELLEKAGVSTLVRPVLIYWGWRVKLPKQPVRRVEGVRLVYGIDAERWLPLLTSRRITPEAEASAWGVLSKRASEFAE